MRETDVLVVGAGRSGLAAAKAAATRGVRVLLLEKRPDFEGEHAPVPTLTGHMALDLILDADHERVAGVLCVTEDGAAVPVKAGAVILAAGAPDGLFPGAAKPRNTGDALAMALRIPLELPAQQVLAKGARFEVQGGVPTDGAGRTPMRGLYAVGGCASQREEGAPTGVLAATDLPKEAPRLGDYRVLPDIDSPIPPAFSEHKLQRVRELMARAFGEPPMPAVDALVLMHRLKGEADDFARARLDLHLKSFQNATEVGVLLLKARAGAP